MTNPTKYFGKQNKDQLFTRDQVVAAIKLAIAGSLSGLNWLDDAEINDIIDIIDGEE